mgnify:CR=1 FL=1
MILPEIVGNSKDGCMNHGITIIVRFLFQSSKCDFANIITRSRFRESIIKS